MHLTTAIVLLIGSLAAAAPSIQHAQISVEVIHTDAQNHADVVHSSVGTGTNNDGFGLKYLPFNFTLSARYANGGPTSLPFGFENLDVGSDGFVRGELGFPTVFAFREGKLINGNRALGGHVHRIFPGWTSLWSLERAVHRPWFELIAIPQPSTLKPRYYLEFERSDQFLGVYALQPKEPVFVGPAGKNFINFDLFLRLSKFQFLPMISVPNMLENYFRP